MHRRPSLLANPSIPRRKFTPEEDHRLRSLVASFGTKRWEEIAHFVPERTPRQCRDRYKNYLVDSLMTDPWTPEEDALVMEQYHRIGPKWVQIGKMLSGRSGNNVKNRWHKHLSRIAAQRPPPPVDVKTQGHPEEQKKVPVEAGGFTELIAPAFFGSVESTFGFDNAWSRGFSLEDSLF